MVWQWLTLWDCFLFLRCRKVLGNAAKTKTEEAGDFSWVETVVYRHSNSAHRSFFLSLFYFDPENRMASVIRFLSLSFLDTQQSNKSNYANG